MVENSGVPMDGSSASWFEGIKESALSFWQKIKDSKSVILDMVLFFGIGFLIGYFLRKYGQYVAALIVFLVCLVLLAQLNIIDIAINWNKVQQLFGMQPVAIPEGGALISAYWQWLKLNMFAAASFCVGFLVGLRMS